MQQTRTSIISGYPKGVFFIALTQMWESFSYFGMRVLLVLYLISQLGFSKEASFILYTLYVALVQIGAVFGGYVADRFIGYRRGVLLGGGLILMGHIILAIFGQGVMLYAGLSAIVVGSSTFRVSLQALLGQLYEKVSDLREKGFTLFYVGMNLGGLSAAVSCGFVAQMFGWHVGFGLAALGMSLGMILFYKNQHQLKTDLAPAKKLQVITAGVITCIAGLAVAVFLLFFATMQYVVAPLGLGAFGLIMYQLNRMITKKRLYGIAGVLLLLTLFFAVEALWGSLLMVFAETQVNRSILGVTIPSAVIAAINPLVIIVIGPLIAKTSMRLAGKSCLAFLCLGLAFVLFYAMTFMLYPSGLYLCLGLGLIALGELLLVPAAQTYVYQAGSEKFSGLMMGAVTLAVALGTIFSGKIAEINVGIDQIFLGIGLISLLIFLILKIKWSPFIRKQDVVKN